MRVLEILCVCGCGRGIEILCRRMTELGRDSKSLCMRMREQKGCERERG